MSRRPQPVEAILASRQLRRYQQFAEQYRQWQRHLHDLLGKQVASHCEVISIREERLLIRVDSAAWATRLKFQQRAIITYFQNHAMASVTSLEIKINPGVKQSAQTPNEGTSAASENAQSTPVKQPSIVTTEASASKLKRLAADCDEPLKSQLLALAAKFEQTP